MRTSLFLATLGLIVAPPGRAAAQGARILRPNIVADSSRQLHVAPRLAGYNIGEPDGPAGIRLGPSVHIDTLGDAPGAPVSLTNPETGITLVVSEAEGVGIILITTPTAGALDGLRVGDTREVVLAKWGPPAAGDESGGLWLGDPYVITVSFDAQGKVTRLGIGLGQ